jgi:hypothetical protein
MKFCPKCKQEKNLDLFAKDCATKSGYQCYCRACVKVVYKAYREKNKEEVNERRKLWGEQNKEHVKAYSQKITESISPGVYMIKNKLTGDCYIGQSTQPYRRRGNHFSLKKKEVKYKIKALHEAMLKYGKEVFVFGVIEHCSEEELLQKEKYYIQEYKPQYNILR